VAAPTLDLSDIQGDILRAYGNAYLRTSYIFVRIDDGALGRQWLSGLVDTVRNAEPWTDKPDTHLNIAITYAGLAKLGVPESVLSAFPQEYRQGMAPRAEVLGDTGLSDPSRWDRGLGRGEPLVLATLNAKTPALLDAQLAELRAGVEASGCGAVAYEQHAQSLESGREHFGYADGFAQPAIEGATDDKAAGGGVPEAKGAWRPLAPGEFILGYPDEDTRDDPKGKLLPEGPPDPLGRSGTYMVWRKMHQDVALFRRTLSEAAARFPAGDEELLAAKVVGRWRDGTPLERSPTVTDPSFDPEKPETNDFRYEDDLDGRRCPVGAHVRRANPRDALGFEGMLSYRHRMIRRGMPYGPELPKGADDDGKERGLVFVCFQASIERQFESVQAQWINDGNIFHLGHDKDFLVGDGGGTGKMTVQGEPPFFLAPQPSFVSTRGGEYLFVPGITALAAIADGVTG
jgi:Dyp-type peroxidase family